MTTYGAKWTASAIIQCLKKVLSGSGLAYTTSASLQVVVLMKANNSQSRNKQAVAVGFEPLVFNLHKSLNSNIEGMHRVLSCEYFLPILFL